MLCLSRKLNEVILIGNDITVQVIEIRADKVRLGITAPLDVPIFRTEVLERMKAGEPLHKIEEDLDHRDNQ